MQRLRAAAAAPEKLVSRLECEVWNQTKPPTQITHWCFEGKCKGCMLLQLLRNHCCCCWGGGDSAGIVKPDKTKANANHQLRLSIDRQMQRLHAAVAAKKPLFLLLNTRHYCNSEDMHCQTVQVNAKYETWMQRPQLSITVQCTWPLSHKVVFWRTERETRLECCFIRFVKVPELCHV